MSEETKNGALSNTTKHVIYITKKELADKGYCLIDEGSGTIKQHKYLSDIGVANNEIPENFFAGEEDPREKLWNMKKSKYGVDPCETWCLNDWFFMWFYEHLMMYNEVNNVATTDDSERVFLDDNYETFITFQDAIDELLELSKWLIKNDGMNLKDMTYKEFTVLWKEKYDRFMFLFGKTLHRLWW